MRGRRSAEVFGALIHMKSICLIGEKISNDLRLICSLKQGYRLTLIERAQKLYMGKWSADFHIGWLLSTSVLVLDCTKSGGVGLTARDFGGIISFLRFVK